MIQYSLKCAQGHSFDSWFQSASAFDKLQAAQMLSCPHCGSCEVTKVLMAPAVRPARSAAKPIPTDPSETGSAQQANPPAPDTSPVSAQAGAAQQSAPVAEPTLSSARSETEQMLKTLREHVEKNSEYVGSSFAEQARAMHLGDTPEKPIYGEANPEEAKSLIEDGVPVLPLPFRPNGKNN